MHFISISFHHFNIRRVVHCVKVLDQFVFLKCKYSVSQTLVQILLTPCCSTTAYLDKNTMDGISWRL